LLLTAYSLLFLFLLTCCSCSFCRKHHSNRYILPRCFYAGRS